MQYRINTYRATAKQGQKQQSQKVYDLTGKVHRPLQPCGERSALAEAQVWTIAAETWPRML
jgi:hypothetical protein